MSHLQNAQAVSITLQDQRGLIFVWFMTCLPWQTASFPLQSGHGSCRTTVSSAEPTHSQWMRPHKSSHFGLWKTTAPRRAATKSAMISSMSHKVFVRGLKHSAVAYVTWLVSRLRRGEDGWSFGGCVRNGGLGVKRDSLTIPWGLTLSLLAGFWFEWVKSLSLYSRTCTGGRERRWEQGEGHERKKKSTSYRHHHLLPC